MPACSSMLHWWWNWRSMAPRQLTSPCSCPAPHLARQAWRHPCAGCGATGRGHGWRTTAEAAPARRISWLTSSPQRHPAWRVTATAPFMCLRRRTCCRTRSRLAAAAATQPAAHLRRAITWPSTRRLGPGWPQPAACRCSCGRRSTTSPPSMCPTLHARSTAAATPPPAPLRLTGRPVPAQPPPRWRWPARACASAASAAAACLASLHQQTPPLQWPTRGCTASMTPRCWL